MFPPFFSIFKQIVAPRKVSIRNVLVICTLALSITAQTVQTQVPKTHNTPTHDTYSHANGSQITEKQAKNGKLNSRSALSILTNKKNVLPIFHSIVQSLLLFLYGQAQWELIKEQKLLESLGVQSPAVCILIITLATNIYENLKQLSRSEEKDNQKERHNTPIIHTGPSKKMTAWRIAKLISCCLPASDVYDFWINLARTGKCRHEECEGGPHLIAKAITASSLYYTASSSYKDLKQLYAHYYPIWSNWRKQTKEKKAAGNEHQTCPPEPVKQ